MLSAGQYCDDLSNYLHHDLDLDQIQIDEAWTFVYKKQRVCNTEEWKNPNIGDQFLFYAIDRTTKFIPAWTLGKRHAGTASEFLWRLKDTLNGCKPIVSSDGFRPYLDLVPGYFGDDVNYGTVIKDFAGVSVDRGRYGPPLVDHVRKKVLSGNIKPEQLCTSHIERANLTLRTLQRRFTRLALGFSKKLENLKAACALYFAYYNYCWIPRTTGVTPAMAAGIPTKPWTTLQLVPE